MPAARIDGAGELLVELVTAEGYRGDGPLRLVCRVTNPTRRACTFCQYHTPFEGIRNDIFTVTTADGAAVPYRGSMAKRTPPRPQDFRRVEPGQSVTADVDLRDGYELVPGVYRVAFSGNAISGLPASAAVTVTVGT